MDNALLKQLIEQHRRVVIPDFGAFLKKETPEGESLVFSPFLRKDDGMITDALVQEYGVETDDARAMVGEFVIYLRQSLASTGRYYIEGVGMLKADANGTITLMEGETPEPQAVEPEPVPVQTATAQPTQQPLQTGPATPYNRPVQPSPQAMPQPGATSTPGMTRPHSIQVQPPVPPAQQGTPTPPTSPVQQMPVQTGGYGGVPPIPMNGGYAQRGTMPGQPPYPPVPPMGQQPGPIPPRTPQPPMNGGTQPLRGGQPPIPGQRTSRPSQPSAGSVPRERPPMPMGGGNVPLRGPQEGYGQRMNPQGGNNGRGPGNPGGPNAKTQQGAQRHPVAPKRKAPKNKTDIWLIVAIIAALIVIAIMVYGFINTGHGDLDMELIHANMAPQEDTVTVIVPEAAGTDLSQ